MKTTHRIVASFAGATLLIALVVLISFWSFRQMKEAADARKHTFVVMARANDFLSALKDAETGQRGYLLTGDEVFLEPYLDVRDGLSGQLEELRRLVLISDAHHNLDALAPLVDAKLAEMSLVIELRRKHDMSAVLAAVGSGQGKRLMDSIRAEMSRIIQIEEGALAKHEAEFQSNMLRLFTIIIIASLLMLLFALSFAYLIYREAQHRLKNLVHLKTKHLLELQEETNKQLQQANVTLQVSEEKRAVTLNAIGDAVMATDAEGRVTLLNPVAEQLTGWMQAEAAHCPVDEIFHIINQETRQPSTIPIKEVLERGTRQGLANHTILIARNGSECAIADSCAPIRDRDGRVVGAVLVFRDVTKEYAAQQALHDSAALIQTILNTVVDGIITLHASGSIIETVNPAAERMFGYVAAELIGQHFTLLIPELDRDNPNDSLEYYIAGGEARSAGLGREMRGHRKDGSMFPLEIAVSEMWLGGKRHFTGIVRDITLRKQVEEQLRWTEESFRLMVESVTDYAIVMLDPEGRVVSWNSGAQRIKGYRAEEILGQHFSRFYPPEDIDRGTPQRDLDVVTAKGRFEDEGFRARKDGSTFWANVVFTAIRDQGGNLRGFAKLTRDLTEHRKAEAELTNAKSLAERANLAKSEFLSSMSHELRSPLNAILGFAQLMDSDSPPATPSQKASIDRILQAGWYLLALINEILDLAVVESGKLSLSNEPVSLAEIMAECQTLIEPQGQKRGIKLTFPQFDIPSFVRADRTRLKQVLINLLSNAIKYNQPGGTVVVDTSTSIPGRTRIRVRDTGAGLPPEKLTQLFQPFNRLGQETSAEEGTGIGLVMSKRLVELMGGAIGVESTVGVGSVFWFELNSTVAPQLIVDSAEAASVAQTQVQPGATMRTLLYVEDNPSNLKLVEQLIGRRPDMHLLSAVNGTVGIELAHETQPDVILMDINLPGISGIEALKILHEDPVTAHIPVLAISANAMPRDIRKGLEAGFFRYLTKPIKINEFMEALDVALEFAKKGMTRNK